MQDGRWAADPFRGSGEVGRALVHDGGGEFKGEGLFAAPLLGGRRGGVCGARFGAWRGAEYGSFGWVLYFAALVGTLLRIGGFGVGAIVSEDDACSLPEDSVTAVDSVVRAFAFGSGSHGVGPMAAAWVSVELRAAVDGLLRSGGVGVAYGGAAEVGRIGENRAILL